jgi:hypothetical protein
MNWKDLINSNFSRKAEIVLIGVAALVYVATVQAAEGKTLDPVILKWAIAGIIAITLTGIGAQTLLDWRWPNHDRSKLPHVPDPPAPPARENRP